MAKTQGKEQANSPEPHEKGRNTPKIPYLLSTKYIPYPTEAPKTRANKGQ